MPVVRVDAGGSRQLLPQLQDVLGLRLAKAKPVAVRADVSLREPGVWSRDRPGPQRVAQPEGTRGVSGYREWSGNLPPNGANARGEERLQPGNGRCSSANREAGTGSKESGETGTAVSQEVAAWIGGDR